ncbi:YciI family protein [Streptomyces sp. YIM S03343]
MPYFLLSVAQPTGGQPPAPAELDAIMRDIQAFNQDLRDAGAFVFAGGLDGPGTATVLRPASPGSPGSPGGEVTATDGPFAEPGDEYLAGLSLIRADDRAEALRWARKAALATTLPVEVRQFVHVD